MPVCNFSDARLQRCRPIIGDFPFATAEPLALLSDTPPSEQQSLFQRKLQLCAFTFDFTNSQQDVREKEIKRQTLVELVDFVNSGPGKFSEEARCISPQAHG